VDGPIDDDLALVNVFPSGFECVDVVVPSGSGSTLMMVADRVNTRRCGRRQGQKASRRSGWRPWSAGQEARVFLRRNDPERPFTVEFVCGVRTPGSRFSPSRKVASINLSPSSFSIGLPGFKPDAAGEL